MNTLRDILFVEDERVVVEVAQKVFRADGLQVDTAAEAETALQKFRRHAYRVVMTDLMLANISGIDLMLKIHERDSSVPVVIISGYATVENVLRAFEAGAFDFVCKPFEADELLGVTHRALQEHAFSAADRRAPDVRQLPPTGTASTANFYCLGRHAWAQCRENGTVFVGVGTSFAGKMQPIERVEFPPLSADMLQGRVCVRLVCENGDIHVVLSPLSGKVVGTNTQLSEHPDLLDSDPFGEGWLIRLLPTNLQQELRDLHEVETN